jgi:hypothetical protein
MSARRYEGMSVVLPDLVRTTNTLEGYVFYRCRIAGPSVLIIGGGSIFANNFSTSTPDSAFWTVPDDQESTAGAVVAINCVFEECYFHRIGFAGKAADLEGIRATLTYVEQHPPL